MSFEEVDLQAPKKPKAPKFPEKKFKPFDLTITVSSMEDLDFLQVLCVRGIDMAQGHGGFSSKAQGKTLTLLRSIHQTLSENAGV